MIPSFNSYPLGNKIRINHYYYKSQQDYEEKIKRGLATNVKGSINRSILDFYKHINKTVYINTDILKFLPILNKYYSSKIEYIYDTVVVCNKINLDEKIEDLTNNICNNNFIVAKKLLNKLKRYYDTPELDIFELYYYVFTKNEIKVMDLFSKGLIKYKSNNDIIKNYYKAIAHFYSINNRQSDNDSITQFIQ